jgi:hypothetical protein
MNVAITTTPAGDKIKVESPFNSFFVIRARNLGGQWDGRVWQFDSGDEDRVRELCQECYGTDGVTSDLCTLRIEWIEDAGNCQGPTAFHGRTIAKAFGRDSGAKPGEGIVVLAGGFSSGGSVKNWRTNVKSGTIVLVRDFPRQIALQLTTDEKHIYSIEEEVLPINWQALADERKKLVARIAEIDTLIAQNGA